MPQWVPGLGFSSPEAIRSPVTAFSLSSSGTDDGQMALVEHVPGMATEGLHIVATRGRARDDSALSRDGQSAGSLPPLEDGGVARDRSPRRRKTIMDVDRPYGAQRSRDDRGSSPLPITDYGVSNRAIRPGGSRDGSRQRSLQDVPADNFVDPEDTLDADLANEMALSLIHI